MFPKTINVFSSKKLINILLAELNGLTSMKTYDRFKTNILLFKNFLRHFCSIKKYLGGATFNN